MWYKVAWIFLWMTLAFWVGCGSQNQSGNLVIDPQAEAPQAAPGGAPIDPIAAPAAANAVTSGPSLRGIDRSHWAKITLTPDPGLTPHHPAQFNSESLHLIAFTPDRTSPLKGNAVTLDLDATADAVVSGDRAHFNLADTRDLFVAPLNVGYDIVVYPVAATVNPPWKMIGDGQ